MILFLNENDKMVAGIYKIENSINHKVYIGQSKDLFRRMNEHYGTGFRHSKYKLHQEMREYGIENFKFEILKETYDFDYWEKFFIYWYQAYNPDYGYNLTVGGQISTERKDNFIYTDEMKMKMSEAKKNNWNDEDYRKRILHTQLQGRLSEEGRKNRSNSTKQMWLSGKFKDQANKISKTMLGMKRPESTKLKMKESSRLREFKHKQEYNAYILTGKEISYHEFCKHYKHGINDLMNEEL